MNPADFNPENMRFQSGHSDIPGQVKISYSTTPLPNGAEGPEKEEPLMFRVPIIIRNKK